MAVEITCVNCGIVLEKDRAFTCEEALAPINKGFEKCETKVCQFDTAACMKEFKSNCEIMKKVQNGKCCRGHS